MRDRDSHHAPLRRRSWAPLPGSLPDVLPTPASSSRRPKLRGVLGFVPQALLHDPGLLSYL